MPESRTPPPTLDRRTLLLGSIAGMGAMIALPMTAIAPRAAIVLVFSLPLLLAVIARGTGRNGLMIGAFVLLLALSLTFLDVPGTALIATIVVLIGPIVAVILVGAPLRQVDVIAAAGFLGAGTIAIIAGFAAAELDGAAALVVGVGLAGIAVVLYRIGRR
ncbi:MAG: hypothetical protein JJT89_15120 [Nitriliruptoraceae bacterium]|nr:hypothetical protein [Nitriliruptoraceae bacterium]